MKHIVKHIVIHVPDSTGDERLQSVVQRLQSNSASKSTFVSSALAFGIFYLNSVNAEKFNRLAAELSSQTTQGLLTLKRFRLLRDAIPERIYIYLKMQTPLAVKVFVTTSLILFNEMLEAKVDFDHFKGVGGHAGGSVGNQSSAIVVPTNAAKVLPASTTEHHDVQFKPADNQVHLTQTLSETTSEVVNVGRVNDGVVTTLAESPQLGTDSHQPHSQPETDIADESDSAEQFFTNMPVI